MKFSRICLALLLAITYAGSSAQAELPKGDKQVYFTVSGDIPSHAVKIVKDRDNYTKSMYLGPMVDLSIFMKQNHFYSSSIRYRIYGSKFTKDGKFFRSWVRGASSRQFGATDDKLFAKNIIEIPPAIQDALQTQDKVNAVIKFYSKRGSEDNGKYKIIIPANGINHLMGSFDILLADDQPETTETPSEPVAPTPAEEPAGTSPPMVGGAGSWAPGIEKDFHFFKKEVMNEIAVLKKMINQLMEKMNK